MKNSDVKGPQVSHVNEDSGPVDIALNKYVGHPSIFKIKEYFNEPNECNFSEVIPNDIKKEIKNLDSSKEVTCKNITPKSPKEAQDVCSPLSCDVWAKETVQKGAFPKDLKYADVTPVFKKDNPLLAKNYRAPSVLPTVSQIFERIMQKQIIDYITQYLLPCYVDTEKASVHKRLCFISVKNGSLCLIKKDT